MVRSEARGFAFMGPLAVVAGVAAVAVLAAVARGLAHWTGPFPEVVVGLALGATIGNLWGIPTALPAGIAFALRYVVRASLAPGIAFVLRYVLRAAIVLFGFGLSLAQIAGTGRQTLLLIVLCFALALCLGWVTARLFRLNATIGTLIGAGTAICGGSAILAIGPLLGAKDEEIAYALGTIFTFNILALLAYPPIGHALRLDGISFGSWTGTAVNDTSVVVATGYAFSHAAGGVATIVKLTRTLLLVPLALGIGFFAARRAGGEGSLWQRVSGTIPWFVLWFVAAAALRSAGLVPAGLLEAAARLASFLILMVLVAVGLNTDVRTLAKLGSLPLLAGLALAATMSFVSFELVAALGVR